MSIEDIVQLTIVVSSSTLTRPGFGTPLALVSKVPAGWGTGKVREFSKLAELTDLGFATTDAAYKLALAIKSQNPAPAKFKLAKRSANPAQTTALKCLTATQGNVYLFSVGLNNGPTTDLTYTVGASATTSTVATAIAALIAAVSGCSAAAVTDTINVTPTVAGNLVNIKNWAQKGHEYFSLTDNTPDSSVAADLDAALDYDPDWYGVLLDCNSKLQVSAAAAWTEANKKLHSFVTSDTGAADVAVTTDTFTTLKNLSYDRTFGIYNQNETLSFANAAWMARGFAFDPGKITWAYKDLKGISVDLLRTGQRSTLEAKNGNWYENVGGANVTQTGKCASGEWIDTTHGLDWLEAEIKLQVFAAIQRLPKLPYTNAGLGVIEGTLKAVLKAGVRQGLLVDNDNLTVTMPRLADIDPITKAQRLVPNIGFTADLAGAIHKTKIDGTVVN